MSDREEYLLALIRRLEKRIDLLAGYCCYEPINWNDDVPTPPAPPPPSAPAESRQEPPEAQGVILPDVRRVIEGRPQGFPEW